LAKRRRVRRSIFGFDGRSLEVRDSPGRPGHVRLLILAPPTRESGSVLDHALGLELDGYGAERLEVALREIRASWAAHDRGTMAAGGQ
jgi:hypothetical protein